MVANCSVLKGVKEMLSAPHTLQQEILEKRNGLLTSY